MPAIDAAITFLPTGDLEATERFYRDRIGLRLTLDQGRCRLYEISRDAYLGFCLDPNLPSGGRIVLTIVTGDLDGWHGRLTRAGLAPDPIRESEEYRIRHFFVRDPNGYLLEFQTFWDDDWRQGGRYPGAPPRLA